MLYHMPIAAPGWRGLARISLTHEKSPNLIDLYKRTDDVASWAGRRSGCHRSAGVGGARAGWRRACDGQHHLRFPLPRPVITPSFLERLQIETGGSFHCHAITADLQALVERSGVRQGLLVAVGQHTTTALVLNENEERLLRDIEAFFLALAPPERPWLHNDLHLRQGIPPDEPRNAHAHLIAMLLGNQLSLPVVDGRLGIGRWQSVLLVELDGPRQREVLLQLIDTGGPSPPTGSDSMLGAAP